MDFHKFGRHFSDSGAWMPGSPVAPCGALWRPVAPCGGLWRKAVAPIYYHARSLGLAGWQDGVWQAGWMAGWLDGWMAGWKAGWMAGWRWWASQL